MAAYYTYTALSLLCLSCILSASLACSKTAPDLPVKAASLGNWLLVEGWMNDTLFDGIPNKDLLDGTQVRFFSKKLGTYLSAQNGGGANVVANRTTEPSASETFRLWRINETYFNFRTINKQFLGLENPCKGKKLVAAAKAPGSAETFQIIRNDKDPNLVRIRASNGLFIRALSETEVSADCGGLNWQVEDPSVFNMTVLGGLQGEYQLENGLGPKATEFMQNHWNTYIVEEDFKFMSENGINAVRIPIGWWLVHDPTPPKPYVGGGLKVLDNAFEWSKKYNIKVIVDLHAPPTSPNGYQHSSPRDGFLEWDESHIPETVAVIDFLTERYANHSSFFAIELMNEPQAPGLDLEALKKYYKAGYDTVRKYSSTAYVIFANRLGGNLTELLDFASASFDRVVIDLHYYNLFWDGFNNMTVQQNIDFIKKNRAHDIQTMTKPNGPLIFVGEWTAEWKVKNATKQDYQRFAKAQLEVFGRANFGWAYWAYTCQRDHWNMNWMIKNNYMQL